MESDEGRDMMVGFCEMQGWRDTMEDAHLAQIAFTEKHSLFAVFDGHGGQVVAKFVAKHLPKVLSEQPAFQNSDYPEALAQAFFELDRMLIADKDRELRRGIKQDVMETPPELLQFLQQWGATQAVKEVIDGPPTKKAKTTDADNAPAEDDAPAAVEFPTLFEGSDTEEEMDSEEEFGAAGASVSDSQGCTAVVALLEHGPVPRLYVANAGDSRAVLCRRSEAGAYCAVDMTLDHKPGNPAERERIEAAGSQVTEQNGDVRIDYELNLSRALGDTRFKKHHDLPPTRQVVTANPEVWSVDLTSNDLFLLLGCDGIFEKLSNQAIIDHCAKKIFDDGNGKNASGLADICGGFLEQTIAADPEAEGYLGCDNMSMMLVKLPTCPGAKPTEIMKYEKS